MIGFIDFLDSARNLLKAVEGLCSCVYMCICAQEMSFHEKKK